MSPTDIFFDLFSSISFLISRLSHITADPLCLINKSELLFGVSVYGFEIEKLRNGAGIVGHLRQAMKNVIEKWMLQKMPVIIHQGLYERKPLALDLHSYKEKKSWNVEKNKGQKVEK